MNERSKGMFYALAAYGAWGFMPVYIRSLRGMGAFEIVAHRALWSCVLMAAGFFVQRRWAELGTWLRDWASLWRFALSALLLSLNWCLYVVSVGLNRVVDASLGYFINPLISVVFGVTLLRERLRTAQWFPIGLAALGVSWLTFVSGHVPWIGLTLAVSFACYGLIRKTARLGSFEGLLLETLFVAPFALGYLCLVPGFGRFGQGTLEERLLIVSAGVVTAVPLLLFSMGARRVPLSQMGVLQYLSPTIQFCLGALVWKEPFPTSKLVGYALIWTALGIYSVEGYLAARRSNKPTESVE